MKPDDKLIIDFNHNLIRETLSKGYLFTEQELIKLLGLQLYYQKKLTRLSELEFMTKCERLAIDLSWKSSQIEGNAYSLSEAESLWRHEEVAKERTRFDTDMLLNHREAIGFISEHSDYVKPLTLRSIEDIHSILVKELGVERNIRKRMVAITGTNYRPLDNEFQIREAIEDMCELVNTKDSVFEKALLTMLLISYIQPFNDGNKRTARIIGNAILIAEQYCPISFKTVDSMEYREAMLIFYEQNNVEAFKKIFIEQFEFAVSTYF